MEPTRESVQAAHPAWRVHAPGELGEDVPGWHAQIPGTQVWAHAEDAAGLLAELDRHERPGYRLNKLNERPGVAGERQPRA